MDDRIAIGNKMEMVKVETGISANPDKREVIYASHVVDEAEDGDIIITMPIHEGRMIPFSIGQEVLATFYAKTSLLGCQMVVTARYKKDALFLLKLKQLTTPVKIQRREYYRLGCYTQIEYRVVSEKERALLEGNAEWNSEEFETEWKEAVMLDLSGGGIRFVSAFEESKDKLLQVRFPMHLDEESKVIYSYVLLLSSERQVNDKTVYEQRVEFYQMSEQLRESIIQYIFETQRRNRMKELGLY